MPNPHDQAFDTQVDDSHLQELQSRIAASLLELVWTFPSDKLTIEKEWEATRTGTIRCSYGDDDDEWEVSYESDIDPDANQTIDEAWAALKRHREQRNT